MHIFSFKSGIVIYVTNMSNQDEQLISNKTRELVFLGLGILSILLSYLLTPSFSELMKGFLIQQTAPGLLDTNTFMIVGEGRLGTPFLNAGLLIILVLLSYRLTNTELNGNTIAAMFMVFGFGFCGKTLWSGWPLFFGVLLYALRNHKPIQSMIGLAWFSTALSPIVSVLTLYTQFDGMSAMSEVGSFSLFGFVLAIIVGLCAGYLTAVMANVLPGKHEGLTLFNAGLAAGLAGFFVFSIMKSIGIAHSAPVHEYPNLNNRLLFGCLCIYFLYLLIMGFLINQKEKRDIKAILLEKHQGDAIKAYGFGATLINMAVCGCICLVYFLCTRTGNMHGPIYSSIITIVGFSSNGISPKTMIPTMVGVYLTSFLLGGMHGVLLGESFIQSGFNYVGSKNMMNAAVYSCGMAPVVIKYGAFIGLLAGVIHSIIVPNTGVLHGWLNLYNNGFSVGFVVTFFVPAILAIKNQINQKEEK